MKNKQQKYVWLSLLLTGILCVSSGAAVWANDADGTDVLEQASDAGGGDIAELMEGLVAEQETETQENSGGDDQIKAGEAESITLSQNGDMSGTVSDNSLSSGNMNQGKRSVETDVQPASEDIRNEAFSVVLPVEIPFGITLLNREGLKGVANSRQFCIENRGNEDVRISLQGFCKGLNDDEYVMSNFVENGIVQGKKNVWMYMRWEDEERGVLDEPQIMMGKTSPGTGEIVLEAPEKDENGIVGESKAYFSFCGALESDTGDSWKDNELTIELIFSMQTVNSADPENLAENEEVLPGDLDTMENPMAIEQPESVSDNMGEVDAHNENDILDHEENVQFTQVSGDNTNMFHDEEALQKSSDIEN